MEKIIRFFIVLCTLFYQNSVKSQVSIYTFSQGIGTYNPISGGILFGSVTSDDQVFLNPAVPAGVGVGSTGPGLPLGFNFIFNGISYDRIGINCNGFIFFGQSTFAPAVSSQIGNAYAPISSTSAAQPLLQQKVSGLGMDLQGQTGSELRMEVIGVAPTRTAVVQWAGFRKYNQAGDDYNFQIRLHETSNIIEVAYGNFVNNAQSGLAQVGLRGQGTTDYNTRFVNAINVWSISALGSAANSVANIDNSLKPQNGLIYRWTPAAICSGTPSANSILASLTTICPGGSSSLSLANTYTNSGLIYQWFSSTTSSTSGYVAISPGGTASSYSPSNVSTNTWYNCAITCTNGGSIVYTSPLLVSTIGSVVSTVPYQEDFENILVTNALPNCSWATSASTICQTYTTVAANNRAPHTGTKFAAFKSGTNVNGDYFYTNVVKLYAGMTYSASVWYITDGNSGWSNFSILYGPSQSPGGLITIASASAPLNAISYQQLSNTFTVAASSNYFFAIRCIGNSTPFFLSFDDISITAPCNLNAPAMVVAATPSTICSGQTATISATGANSYTWTGGVYASSVTVSPSLTSTYYVIGTNTLSSCSNTLSQLINVEASPALTIYTSGQSVCAGKTATLSALGGSTYSWSTGSNQSIVVVSPSVTSTYTVVATGSNGCSTSFTQQLAVAPVPNMSVTVSPILVCEGQSATLNANGADTYEWKANSLYSPGSTVTVAPSSTTSYSVTGTNSLSCSSTQTILLTVEPCIGLAERASGSMNLQVYPNPFSDYLKVKSEDGGLKWIGLLDAYGTLLEEWQANGYEQVLATDKLKQGIYLLSIQADFGHKNLIIVRQ